MDLDGKVAIVTGGAVRIGRAIALALAAAKANVLVHYSHSSNEAQRTVDDIAALGAGAAMVAADLASPSAAETVLQAAIDRFGRCDILINSASVFAPGTLASTTSAEFDRIFDLNLRAPILLSREFALRKATGAHGVIINMADWRGLRWPTGYLAYTLTKSALITLTRILAVELAPDIRVNAVAPGAILPPPGGTQEHLERLKGHIPLGRTGEVGDVTSAVLFLLQSEFVTGEVLCVTGGEHLK